MTKTEQIVKNIKGTSPSVKPGQIINAVKGKTGGNVTCSAVKKIAGKPCK